MANSNQPEARPEVTAELARAFLHYDPLTGAFTWRHVDRVWFPSDTEWRSWNNQRAGHSAGTKNGRGYIEIHLRGRSYGAHRLAWLITTGEWPASFLDHINHREDDNRLVNLRPVTQTENMQNSGPNSRNTSGRVGVRWVPRLKKWRAWIRVDGHTHMLGCFASKEDAIRAREVAEIAAGYHPNHGRDVVEGAYQPVRIVIQTD